MTDEGSPISTLLQKIPPHNFHQKREVLEEKKKVEILKFLDYSSYNLFDQMSDKHRTKGYYDKRNQKSIDEIELFIRTASEIIKEGEKQACESIYNQIRCFFALKAYDAKLVVGDMKAADHAIEMADTYEDLVNNLPIVSDYDDIFFSKWPEGRLPDKYIDYIDELYNDGPGSDEKLDDYIAKNASIYNASDKETKLKVYFGAELLKVAKEATSVIKTQHNRYIF